MDDPLVSLVPIPPASQPKASSSKGELHADPPAVPQQDLAYTTLRQGIMVGRFPPGDRLKIRDVARSLGLGEMPVRAALQRLAAEGALVNTPNAGVSIPLIAAPAFDDLLQARLLLEGELTERGVYRLDPAVDLPRLQGFTAQMERALRTRNASLYLSENERLHELIYQRAGSPVLMQLVEHLWLKAGPLSTRLFDHPLAWTRLNSAHQEMMHCVLQNDSRGARLCIESDIYAAGQMVREILYSP